MAATIFPDTHKIVAALKRSGFRENQATGLVEATQLIDVADLVTTADLRMELKDLELRITNTLTNRIIAVVGIGVAILALIKFL